MTILSLLAIGIYFILDKTHKKLLAIPCSIFIFFYGLSFDLYNWDEIQNVVFQFKTIELGFINYIVYFITVLSFAIGIKISCNAPKVIPFKVEYNLTKMKKIYYYLSYISILAFILNLHRVLTHGGLLLLFSSPRLYEETFGASTFLNYLYFLNIPALCLYLYLKEQGIKIKHSKYLNIILVGISFFHGIKFTIFDTILYPVCFYYIMRKQVKLKTLIYSFSILLAIFLVFSIFVRGGSSKSPFLSILLYIVPNYYNLSYSLETSPEQFGIMGLFSLFTPDKMPAMPSYEYLQSGTISTGFILNEAYNMPTALVNVFYAFNMLGPLFYVAIFLFFRFCYKRSGYSLYYLFLSTYILFCLLFSFYFYAFTKTKNIYLVFIIALVHLYCKKAKKYPMHGIKS